MPRGFLSVFRWVTRKKPKSLLTLACPTNGKGDFVAPELAREQTFENLEAFGERLARAHEQDGLRRQMPVRGEIRMPIYEITVGCPATVTTRIRVTAESLDKAEEEAVERAKDESRGGLDWEVSNIEQGEAEMDGWREITDAGGS